MAQSAQELKRKILEDEFSNLNPMQKQAVFATGNPLLILAGAGSGKTTVIVNKIGYLIKYGHTATDTSELMRISKDVWKTRRSDRTNAILNLCRRTRYPQTEYLR